MINFYPLIRLVGGLDGDLDQLDGATLADKDGAIVITAQTTYVYTLDELSGAVADGLSIVEPVTNAGTKRWLLVHSFNTLNGAMSHMIYSNFPGAF